MAQVLQFPSQDIRWYDGPRMWLDSMRNFLAGFGVAGRDKAMSQRFVLNLLDPEQLTAAYRCDWVARKVVDIPAFDSCRAWREWQADKKQIEQIEKAEKQFGLQRKLMGAIAKARLFGGAAMVMGIDGQRFEDELDLDSVKKDSLKFVHVCSRWYLTAGPIERNITSPWFGEPTYYQRDTAVTPPPIGGVTPPENLMPNIRPGDTLYIHPSRVVRLIGLEYPDIEQAPDQWGDSALQTVFDAIRDAGMVSSSIASMVSEAKLDIIKVPGLTQSLATDEGARLLYERFSQANVAKSVVNATMLDKEEEWERKDITFAGMDRTLAAYLMLAAGAADIPATRLLGRSPDGQNSTGESDMRNYYDRLSSDQGMRITPALTRLDEVLLRHVFGNRPEEIHYNWSPLWQLSESEKADVNLKTSQAHKIDVDNGLLNPDVLREGRQNQLIEQDVYPGLEAAIDEFGSEPDEEDIETQLARTQMEILKKPPVQPGAKPNGGGARARPS